MVDSLSPIGGKAANTRFDDGRLSSEGGPARLSEDRLSPFYSHPPERPPLDLRRRLLAGLVGLALLAPDAAWAETFTINSEGDLRTALTNAQSGDTISFNSNVTLTTGDLPIVQKNISILGNDHSLSGNNQFRGLFIAAFQPGTGTLVPVTVEIQDLTIADARAQGGSGGNSSTSPLGGGGGGAGLGGALFVAAGAQVTVSNLSLRDNDATGGNGGQRKRFFLARRRRWRRPRWQRRQQHRGWRRVGVWREWRRRRRKCR